MGGSAGTLGCPIPLLPWAEATNLSFAGMMGPGSGLGWGHMPVKPCLRGLAGVAQPCPGHCPCGEIGSEASSGPRRKNRALGDIAAPPPGHSVWAPPWAFRPWHSPSSLQGSYANLHIRQDIGTQNPPARHIRSYVCGCCCKASPSPLWESGLDTRGLARSCHSQAGPSCVPPVPTAAP